MCARSSNQSLSATWQRHRKVYHGYMETGKGAAQAKANAREMGHRARLVVLYLTRQELVSEEACDLCTYRA